MLNNKGISIVVASAKGGVGKTITTLNLAGIFEVLQKKVLIIDFDLSGGGISAALNIPNGKSSYHFAYDYNNNQYQEFKNYITKYDEYIDVLASPKDPRQAGKIDAKYVEIILDKAVFNYDVVLIDTTHDLTDFNILTLDLADFILFLVTNDPLDLKNMRSLISIFKDLDMKNYKVILNESIFPFKDYFGIYDIKNIIKANIDYSISSAFFIPNIDSYVMNGKIITLDKRTPKTYVKDYEVLLNIATDLLVEEEENE